MTLTLPDKTIPNTKKLSTKPLRPESLKGQDGRVIITAPGRVVSIRPEHQLRRYRVGLRLFFKDLSRTVILQYIAQRQVEIIRELGTYANELYSRKKSE